jgi:hypothetical protein
MNEKEDKKTLSSIGVLKKTIEENKPERNDIGVEADIPVEGDNSETEVNLNAEWKVNQPQKVEEKKGETPESDGPKIDLKISENRVQVFNISAGRVMEKDLSGPEETEKKTSSSIYVDKSVLEKNKRPASAIKQNSQGLSSKLIIGIIIGIVLLLILIFLISSRGGSSDSSSSSASQPQINLTK